MSGRATTPLFLLLAGLALLGASAGAAQKAAVARDVYDLLENDRRQVTDADVMKLCEDKSLTELDLSGCSQLTVACLKDIAALKSLKLLDISDIRNLGEPSTFAALKELPSLEELRMRNAESFKGEGVDQLKRLKRLDVSRASGKFGDSGFAGFKDMSGLTHLYINQSRNYHANKGMSYAGVKHLEGLVNLKALGLYGLHGLKDEDYNALFSKLKALEDLNIGFNWAHKGEGLKLPENLRILDARESFSLLDEPILGMKKDKLESLNLFHCYKITNATLESLKGLTGLKRLALGGIRDLTDEGLLHLQGNTGLSHLSLNDNENFTDERDGGARFVAYPQPERAGAIFAQEHV
jgi:F-box/leucine-rich repeat protein 14